MHLRLLPEKGKYKFRGVKMEMLVTKFSKRKYRNEGDLFAEPISADNVKLMGEMIALQALRTVKKFDMKVADKLYIGLIKDLHHMSEIDYIVSDGYDVAQTAICFFYQFVGHTANEIYGKDKQGNLYIKEDYPLFAIGLIIGIIIGANVGLVCFAFLSIKKRK